jgi:hypothetical protein
MEHRPEFIEEKTSYELKSSVVYRDFVTVT